MAGKDVLWKSDANLSNSPRRIGKRHSGDITQLKEVSTTPAAPCACAEAASLLGYCLPQGIGLELNQAGVDNFPLAASLHFITQNISRVDWLHLRHPLIDLIHP